MPLPAPFPAARYRLQFTTQQPIHLPAYAGSALRGAFGHALKQIACVTRLPACKSCALYRSCAYPAIFETPPPLNYARRTISNVPLPFVVEPPPWGQREHAAGSALHFNTVLVGPALGHLPLVLMAWRRALLQGLGPQQGTAQLDRVFVEDDPEPVLSSEATGPRAHVQQLPLPPLHSTPSSVTLVFDTPLRLQRGGQLLGVAELTAPDLLRALLRRVAELVELQLGGSLDDDFAALSEHAATVRGDTQLTWRDWTRQSSRQQQHMVLGGAVGRFTLHGDLAPFWPLLHLGQWLHVGKNTTFGLGRYRIEEAA